MSILPPESPYNFYKPHHPNHDFQYSLKISSSDAFYHQTKILVWDEIKPPIKFKMSKAFVEEHLDWTKLYELNGNRKEYAFYPHYYDVTHTEGNIQVPNYNPIELHFEEMTKHQIAIWKKQLKPDTVFICS